MKWPRVGTAAIAAALQIAASSAVAQSLDFESYRTRVEPIFLKRRPGHARCIVCHASAGRAFRLQPLSPGSATWTEEQSRRNFENVSNLVVPGNPTSSPLLLHPLAAEAGGDRFHSGGRQFVSQNDPDWQIVAEWVRQAKPAR
jgi:hypothetical protein